MSLEFPDTWQSDEGTTAYLRRILSGVSLLYRNYRVCFTPHDRTFVAKPDGIEFVAKPDGFIFECAWSELILIDDCVGNKSKGKGMTINEMLRVLNGEVGCKGMIGNGPAFWRLYKDDAVPVMIHRWEEGDCWEEGNYCSLTGDGYEMFSEQKELYFFIDYY